MSDDSGSDSDFGLGSSSPLLDDNEPSTTTQESVVDSACRQQQWQQEDVDVAIMRGRTRTMKNRRKKMTYKY